MKYTLTLLICLWAISFGHAQKIGDTLKVSLSRAYGPGPFRQSFSPFDASPVDSSNDYYGLYERGQNLPSAYSNFKIGSLTTNFPQMAYAAIKTGKLDSTKFYNGWFGEGTNNELSLLSPIPVDVEISIAFGKIGGVDHIIIDENNNEDFSDEELIALKPFDLSSRKSILSPQIFTAKVERYVNNQIEEETASFVFMKMFGDRFSTNHSDHRYGRIKVGEEELHLYINNSYYGIDYSNRLLKLLPFDSVFELDTTFNESMDPLGIKEHIKGDKYDFQIIDIDQKGTQLTLLIDEKIERKGIKIGQQAPDLKGWRLDNHYYQLKGGKVTLIDFWGTWCAPCIAEIPYLQDAFKLFKVEGFEIVSIANDQKKNVEDFLSKHSMPWVHLMENEAETAKNDFRIDSYPTTFLLNKDNRIIQKDFHLRNTFLIKTLAEYFEVSLREVQDRLNQGNLVLSFTGERISSLSVEASFIDGTQNFYSLLGPNGFWERGFDVKPGTYEIQIRTKKIETNKFETFNHSIVVKEQQDQQTISINVDELK